MTSHCSRVAALAGLLACASAAHAQTLPWDRQLPASKRFEVLTAFGEQAVLDKETGLVWERTPGDANGDGVLNFDDESNWFTAHRRCRTATTGNRQAWRLPTYEELSSLVDPGVPVGQRLPTGHPFNIVAESTFETFPVFWSASTNARDPVFTIGLSLFTGSALGFNKEFGTNLTWCVRGGQGLDPQ